MSFLDVFRRSFGSDPKRSSSGSPSPRACRGNSSDTKKREHDGSEMKSSRSLPSGGRSFSRSRFSELSTEITQYQKMVRDLESLLKRSGDTPEDQWRSRILLRSARETDSDIEKKLIQQKRYVRNVFDPNIRASYFKLERDFTRTHDSFESQSILYETRQQEALARLHDLHGFKSSEEMKKKALAQQEEEFFYRAMREREAEIMKMNESMHKVNNIYEELGRIVQDQQEHVDKVEDHILHAATYTRAGVDHIKREFPYCGRVMETERDNGEKPPKLRTGEEFRWTMPFETMGEDIKEVVQKDILGLGSDIMSLTSSRNMLQCASKGNVSESLSEDSAVL